MVKTLLGIISFVWACQGEAYIQNGFSSGSKYAPVQISSVPNKSPENTPRPITPPTKKTPVAPSPRLITPPVVTVPPTRPPVVAKPEVVKPAVRAPAPQTPPVVQTPPPDDSSSEVTNNDETTAPMQSSPRPQERPATSNDDFRAEATTKALGQTFKGGQVGTLLTSCGALKFGASGKCEPIKVAKDFVPVLLEQIPKCVNQALGLDHESPAAEIFVTHMGAYQNRNVAGSSRVSMHATGRALDVASFTIKTKSGKTIVHKMTIANRNNSFYKNFNKCWPTYKGAQAQCKPNGTHVIDCKDPDHHDHVHLSLPFCPSKSGISGY